MTINELLTPRYASGVCVVMALAAFSLLAPDFAWSQATTATFYGTVTDPSGASIPGATATLTNQDTGAVTTKSTGVSGGFAFTFIPVGTYDLSISTDGFRALTRTGMSLTAGQQLQETFEMTLGEVSQTIEIEGELTQLNTVSAQQLQNYDITQARELPLINRNITGLLKVAAGVVPSRGNSGTGVNLNGMGRNGTVYSVDGTNASGNTGANNPGTYQGGNLIDLLSVESVEAVSVIKGVIPAEYANALGGYVNMITKSGTNQWHGSVFGNFQRDSLNARHQFLAEKPALKYNQFGFSLGGPIVQNKVFIFGTYEGYRKNEFVFVSGNVPTNENRAQLIAAVPEYALMMDSIPEPTLAPESPDDTDARFEGAKEEVRRDDHIDLKGDWVISNNSRFAVTYTHGEPSRNLPRHFIDNNRDWTNSMDRVNFSFTTGGASWTSETRFGRNKTIQDRLDEFFLHINPDQGEDALLFGQRVPTFSTPLGWSGPGAEINHSGGPMTQVEQKYAKYSGDHSLKFGGNYMRLEGTRANPEAPRYSFGTLDDMLNNTPLQVVAKFGTGDWNGLQTTFGFFVQDDWRIASNLTINLGLRYDFYSNFVATGQGATPDAGLYNTDGMSLDGLFTVGPLLPRDKPYGNDANNFAPRFGFAYSPGGSNKTSIRGGFGIMYSTMIPEVFWNQPSQGVNLPNRFDFDQTDIARFAITYPQYNDQFFANVLQATAEDPDAIFVSTLYDPTLKNPYTMQYSLDIQRQITPNLLFQTGFVGMRGLHFPMYRDANQVDRLTGLRPNSRLSQPDYVDNAQQTTYFGWQNSLRKRFSNRLSFDVNYTWSKALSNGGGDIGASYGGENSGSRNQEFFDMRADYGPTQADLTHYFAAGWVFEAPGANSNNAVVKNVLGGWTLSGIFLGATGQPQRITNSGRSGQRADYVGGEAVLSNYQDTLQYLNKDAFAVIPRSSVGIPDHPGSAGNGIVRSPGVVNLDLSIAKNIQIGETVRLQIRTDLINSLNHTNLSSLSTNVTSGSFGRLRNTRGARIAQINLRLTF